MEDVKAAGKAATEEEGAKVKQEMQRERAALEAEKAEMHGQIEVGVMKIIRDVEKLEWKEAAEITRKARDDRAALEAEKAAMVGLYKSIA